MASDDDIGGERRPSSFGYLWWAVACSGVGDGMVLVAFPLLAAEVTENSLMVALVMAAMTLPSFLALLVGGVVDRYDARRISIIGEWARAALLVAFAAFLATGWRPGVPVLIAVVFVIGLGRTLTETVAQVTLPQIVDRPSLGAANGKLATAETLSQYVAGQGAGGFVYAVAVALPFFLDGISFAVSGVLLAVAIPRARRMSVERSTFLADLGEGLRHFRSDATLRLVAGMVVVLAFGQAMASATIVLFARDVLGVTGSSFGILMGVAATGGIVGGLLGRLTDTVDPGVVLVLASVATSVLYLALAQSRSPVVAAACLFIEATAVVLGNVATVTLRQRVIPPAMLGRMGGIFRFLVLGSVPLGAVLGGVLAQGVTLRAPILMAAGVQILAVSLIGARLVHAVRTDPRLVVT